MSFPASWPPRAPSGVRSVRFYVTNTSTANFSDNAYMFYEDAGADNFTPLPNVPPGSTAPATVPVNPWGSGTASGNSPLPQLWCRNMRITNEGAAAIEISFDGTTVHGYIAPTTTVIYDNRYESGISFRSTGAGGTVRVEAW